MPKAAALSCVSTMAYTGSLSGPALIGVIGEMTGLTIMFASVAVLLATVAILNRFTRVGPA